MERERTHIRLAYCPECHWTSTLSEEWSVCPCEASQARILYKHNVGIRGFTRVLEQVKFGWKEKIAVTKEVTDGVHRVPARHKGEQIARQLRKQERLARK